VNVAIIVSFVGRVRALWCASLSQIVKEACLPAGTHDQRGNADAARKWFFSGFTRRDRDFYDAACGFELGTVEEIGRILERRQWANPLTTIDDL
jgi:hypothetical protein